MSSFPAARAFRILGALLVSGGAALLVAATGAARGADAVPSAAYTAAAAVGAPGLVFALAWPLRIGTSALQLPVEIKRTMRVVGACVAVGGLSLLVGGVAGRPLGLAAALAVAAGCAWIGGSVGFWWLAGKLPATFEIGELVAIARSAGLLGSGASSPADREFRRWTGGARAGVPVGAPAPDAGVFTLDGEPRNLTALLAEGGDGPVVLNFGSYTCPHHRRRIGELHALMERWAPRGVRFLTVYVAEAHPEDGWRLPDQYLPDEEYEGDPSAFCFTYARTLEDRIDMARWLIDKKQLRMPVVVDGMGDEALRVYNVWPIRLYVVRDGQVVFCGEQGPFGYDPGAVDAALDETLARRAG